MVKVVNDIFQLAAVNKLQCERLRVAVHGRAYVLQSCQDTGGNILCSLCPLI